MSTYLTYRDAVCFVGESEIHLHHKLILHKVFKACMSSLSKSQFYFFVKLFLAKSVYVFSESTLHYSLPSGSCKEGRESGLVSIFTITAKI